MMPLSLIAEFGPDSITGGPVIENLASFTSAFLTSWSGGLADGTLFWEGRCFFKQLASALKVSSPCIRYTKIDSDIHSNFSER